MKISCVIAMGACACTELGSQASALLLKFKMNTQRYNTFLTRLNDGATKKEVLRISQETSDEKTYASVLQSGWVIVKKKNPNRLWLVDQNEGVRRVLDDKGDFWIWHECKVVDGMPKKYIQLKAKNDAREQKIWERVLPGPDDDNQETSADAPLHQIAKLALDNEYVHLDEYFLGLLSETNSEFVPLRVVQFQKNGEATSVMSSQPIQFDREKTLAAVRKRLSVEGTTGIAVPVLQSRDGHLYQINRARGSGQGKENRAWNNLMFRPLDLPF